MIRIRRTRVLAAALVAAALVLTGCSAPKPGVTFFGNGSAVATQAAEWCIVDYNKGTGSCPEQLATQNYGTMTLHRGAPVEISVAPEVAASRWQIYYLYSNKAGTLTSALVPLLPANQLAYVLHPPTVDDQIVHIEVQATPVVLADKNGAAYYAFAHLWVLNVTPAVSKPAA